MSCASPGLAISPCLDALRGCADQARKCAEAYLTTQVTIQVRRWTEGHLGAGDFVVLRQTVLPKRFPVRQLSQREVSNSGGTYQEGDLVVSDISPPYTSHGGGGFSVEQLDPSTTLPKPNNDIEILYLLEGDQKGVFSLVSLDSASDPTAWSMLLRFTRLSP